MSISLFDKKYAKRREACAESEACDYLDSLRRRVEELTRAGNALVAAQTQMQALLFRASDSIIQFSADGLVEGFNRAAEDLFGYSEVEMLYQDVAKLFELPAGFNGDLPGYLLAYARTVPDQFERPLMGVHRDGSLRALHVSATRISSGDLTLFDDFGPQEAAVDGEGCEPALVILRDITARKLAEESAATRALNEKAALLAEVASEIQAPLRSIREQAAKGAAQGAGQVAGGGDYCAAIERASRELLEQIDAWAALASVFSENPADLEPS